MTTGLKIYFFLKILKSQQIKNLSCRAIIKLSVYDYQSTFVHVSQRFSIVFCFFSTIQNLHTICHTYFSTTNAYKIVITKLYKHILIAAPSSGEQPYLMNVDFIANDVVRGRINRQRCKQRVCTVPLMSFTHCFSSKKLVILVTFS